MKRGPHTMTRLRASSVAVAIALVVVLLSPTARADRTLAEASVLWMIPSGIGVVIGAPATELEALGLLRWSLEIPIPASRDASLASTPHRILLEPGLTFGAHGGTKTSFRGRVGYQLLWWPTAVVTPFVGLGSSLEVVPLARVSLSPEIGTRIALQGECKPLSFDCFGRYMAVTGRLDVFAEGDNRRELVVLLSLSTF